MSYVITNNGAISVVEPEGMMTGVIEITYNAAISIDETTSGFETLSEGAGTGDHVPRAAPAPGVALPPN